MLIEFLVIFMPLVLLFVGVWQLCELYAAQLVVARASSAAGRAASVVLPDNPAFYDGAAVDEFSGLRKTDIELAAGMVLAASPHIRQDFEVLVEGAPKLPSQDFGAIKVVVNAKIDCSGLRLICPFKDGLSLSATSQHAYHGAAYEMEEGEGDEGGRLANAAFARCSAAGGGTSSAGGSTGSGGAASGGGRTASGGAASGGGSTGSGGASSSAGSSSGGGAASAGGSGGGTPNGDDDDFCGLPPANVARGLASAVLSRAAGSPGASCSRPPGSGGTGGAGGSGADVSGGVGGSAGGGGSGGNDPRMDALVDRICAPNAMGNSTVRPGRGINSPCPDGQPARLEDSFGNIRTEPLYDIKVDRGGCDHVVRAHYDHFEDQWGRALGPTIDVATRLLDTIRDATTDGECVGYSAGRPVYKIEVNGQEMCVAITVSSNSRLIGANPANCAKLEKKAPKGRRQQALDAQQAVANAQQNVDDKTEARDVARNADETRPSKATRGKLTNAERELTRATAQLEKALKTLAPLERYLPQ